MNKASFVFINRSRDNNLGINNSLYMNDYSDSNVLYITYSILYTCDEGIQNINLE